ncbi:hypothetical protein BCR34DRAFT_589137 [Clohesyomyces aquaticus]|uniref:Uncharacterized protein n=1 Tax=Clohesyomyces aquaticus TaxID=1231657 RepID=A0A1Y1ZHJ1_9PLEO|nr:hypothetical protein BCR34DRAFT_589137 [Clohesyomyces aquaticus]
MDFSNMQSIPPDRSRELKEDYTLAEIEAWAKKTCPEAWAALPDKSTRKFSEVHGTPMLEVGTMTRLHGVRMPMRSEINLSAPFHHFGCSSPSMRALVRNAFFVRGHGEYPERIEDGPQNPDSFPGLEYASRASHNPDDEFLDAHAFFSIYQYRIEQYGDCPEYYKAHDCSCCYGPDFTIFLISYFLAFLSYLSFPSDWFAAAM